MRTHSQDQVLADLMNDAIDEAGRMTVTSAHIMKMGPGSELRLEHGSFGFGASASASVWHDGVMVASAQMFDGQWHPDTSLEDEAAGLLAEADMHEATARLNRERAERLRMSAAEIASR